MTERPPMPTRAEAAEAEHEYLLDRSEAILAWYDRPKGLETKAQQMDRINRTLDEIPQVFRWFLVLESLCDERADFFAQLGTGAKNPGYKRNRQRRDLFKSMAKAAQIRYEAASRLITTEISFDPTGVPRTRRTL